MTTNEQTQQAQDAQDAKRAALIGKIRALRAKTAEAGASEAEALSAAAKAAELMDLYQVTEADLVEMRGPKFQWAKREAGMANGRLDHKVIFCTTPIARFTGTRVVYRTSFPYGHKVAEYFGEPADVEMATWLHMTVKAAMDGGYREFRRSRDRVGTGAKAAFQAGLAMKVNERLHALIREREAAQRVDTSRALVVVKQSLVQAAFEEAYPRLRTHKSNVRIDTYHNAYGAGQKAGERVGLGRPVGEQGAARALRIGSRG